MNRTLAPSTDPLGDDAARLDHPDRAERLQACRSERVRAAAEPPADAPAAGWVNLHAHTVYSFNAYSFTPAGFAWRARRAGLAAAGIVDFDVLDGVDEFLEAARGFGLRATAGIETRVFVPSFSDRVLNSPGEPGIAYHMGMGFPSADLAGASRAFLDVMRRTAETRNRELVERVNPSLAPVCLDYDTDVLPLTPAGNATERHLCLAYARKAAALFPEPDALAGFWRGALGLDEDPPGLPEGPALQNAIRARTMKRGGVGYVAPDGGAFPTLEATNRFVRESGAIPTLTWLDGLSEGEQALGEWLDTAEAAGTEAVNLIPDRNVGPGVRDARFEALQTFLEEVRRRHLPLIAGTEMNAPGNRFVDDFSMPELAPLLPDAMRGACLFHAHTVLQAHGGLGYTSEWARHAFPERAARNAFFETFGRLLPGNATAALPVFDTGAAPDDLLDRAREQAAAARDPA